MGENLVCRFYRGFDSWSHVVVFIFSEAASEEDVGFGSGESTVLVGNLLHFIFIYFFHFIYLSFPSHLPSIYGPLSVHYRGYPRLYPHSHHIFCSPSSFHTSSRNIHFFRCRFVAMSLSFCARN